MKRILTIICILAVILVVLGMNSCCLFGVCFYELTAEELAQAVSISTEVAGYAYLSAALHSGENYTSSGTITPGVFYVITETDVTDMLITFNDYDHDSEGTTYTLNGTAAWNDAAFSDGVSEIVIDFLITSDSFGGEVDFYLAYNYSSSFDVTFTSCTINGKSYTGEDIGAFIQ